MENQVCTEMLVAKFGAPSLPFSDKSA